jgi:hypothetical protein
MIPLLGTHYALYTAHIFALKVLFWQAEIQCNIFITQIYTFRTTHTMSLSLQQYIITFIRQAVTLNILTEDCQIVTWFAQVMR